MDVFMQFIGSAGYPTSFVAAAVFFIFWHQKMLKSVQLTKDEELQRLTTQNSDLRAENEKIDNDMQLLKEKLWRAEVKLELLEGKNPMKERETDDG